MCVCAYIDAQREYGIVLISEYYLVLSSCLLVYPHRLSIHFFVVVLLFLSYQHPSIPFNFAIAPALVSMRATIAVPIGTRKLSSIKSNGASSIHELTMLTIADQSRTWMVRGDEDEAQEGDEEDEEDDAHSPIVAWSM